MLYHSTRGQSPALPFNEAILRGLASDGGLYVPQSLPNISLSQIVSFSAKSYQEIATEIILPFVEKSFTKTALKAMLTSSYKNFRSEKCAPLHFISPHHAILELFHGPTYAFKDFALQFLAKAITSTLAVKNTKAFLLGATSGDTGSAAIEACKNISGAKISILHPHNMVSQKQRQQMTTTGSSNVNNFAITGNFDDCQHIIKILFNDEDFRQQLSNKGYQLLAINSINFGRILAQIVYYFSAFAQYLHYAKQNPKQLSQKKLLEDGIVISVPTGNFGNVYAAYLAKCMGMPIHKLIVATNKNDILHRFFSSNSYSKQPLANTLSPSMDIMISSNFERLVFALLKEDSIATKKIFNNFSSSGKLSLPKEIWQQISSTFFSHSANDEETLNEMHNFYKAHQYLLDPHTAIAQIALNIYKNKTHDPRPSIAVATAHPVKFDNAVAKANLNKKVKLTELDHLLSLKEKYEIVDNEYNTVKEKLLKTI